MATSQNPDGQQDPPRRRSRVLIGLAVVVGLFVVALVAGTVAVSSPNACAVCHVMQPSVATWRVSAHAAVDCYSCHGTPHPWYLAPATLVERWGMIGRDVSAQLSGEHLTASLDSSGTPIPDATCEQCHDSARTGTSRFAIIIKHQEHAERNGSCVSCHRWTAHLDSEANRDSLMMLQCFNCHGQPDQPKASRECDVCHPKGLDLRPASHKADEWRTTHGQAARADRQPCAMCHTAESCTACHGLEMPHPEGWERGQTGHAVVAKKDRAVCTQCHKGNSELCTMCHHAGFDEKKGPWIKQHPSMVQETGTAFCFKCHDATYCVTCHITGRAAPITNGQ